MKRPDTLTLATRRASRTRTFILLGLLAALCLPLNTQAQTAKSYDNPDTIVVARDGTGEFRNVAEAIEVCRAFMDYHKVIYIKKGTYKEKLVIPQHLRNIELLGESRDETIITWDDHANIFYPPTGKGMGTFRTYTLKVEGNDITLKNLTVENNAARLGQAVALFTTGDRLTFVGCRFLGHQDTIYTGHENTRQLFTDCYIEGTTDFIFGPSVSWFENCQIHSKANSYITAASTPAYQRYGYVFNHCRLTADEGVTKVFLGRPWRDYGYTLFMQCEMGSHIVPAGWHHWQPEREKTARYMEYGNTGPGADTSLRVAWSKQLTKKEAQRITMQEVFTLKDSWQPQNK